MPRAHPKEGLGRQLIDDTLCRLAAEGTKRLPELLTVVIGNLAALYLGAL